MDDQARKEVVVRLIPQQRRERSVQDLDGGRVGMFRRFIIIRHDVDISRRVVDDVDRRRRPRVEP